MFEKIPVAFINNKSADMFKDVLGSFINRHKKNIAQWPIAIGINNENSKEVIDGILEHIPYVREVLYGDALQGKVTFDRIINKTLSYKPKAVVFVPEGYVCIRSLGSYTEEILTMLKKDDTIGAFYLGNELIKKDRFSGDVLENIPIKNSKFYTTTLGFQYAPFLLSASILDDMLHVGNNEQRLHKWYDSECYITLGIKGGCFQKIR